MIEPTQLNDRRIRAALQESLAVRHQSGLLVHEMHLRGAQAIVDIAAIDHDLHAYEIKSAVDDLSRLSKQGRYYDRTCDYVTLVTTNPKHSDAVPKHWGIVIASDAGERGVSFRWQREASRNEHLRVEDLLYVLRGTELARLLRANGQRRLSGVPKPRLVALVIDLLGPTEARTVTLEILRTRKTWSIRQLAVLNEAERLRHAISQPAPRLSTLSRSMF